MSLHFISDGAGNTNENGESFPVAVDVNPEILSNEDTQQYFTHAPCKDESILIWVKNNNFLIQQYFTKISALFSLASQSIKQIRRNQ